jgi:hypothetical protein
MSPGNLLSQAATLIITAVGVLEVSRAGGLPAAGVPEVLVLGQRTELMGENTSASQGTVLEDQLDNRPILRAGEPTPTRWIITWTCSRTSRTTPILSMAINSSSTTIAMSMAARSAIPDP